MDKIPMVYTPVGPIATPQHSLYFIHDTLLVLDQINSEPIKLFIDSPGGSIEDGLLFYDRMQLMRSPVYTIANGVCASMGAILLASGAAGHRYMLPSSRAMLHLPRAVSGGTRQEREVQEQRTRDIEEKIFGVIKKHCKKPETYSFEEAMKEWSSEADQSLWLGASEAVAYGLTDHVVTREIYNELFPCEASKSR